MLLGMRPVERLERAQWDFFWLPDDAVLVDRPELAYVSCARPVHYLNNVYRVRAEPARVPALVREVSEAHRTPMSQWQVTDVVDPTALERELARAGYEVGEECAASVIAVDAFEARPSAGARVERVTTVDQLRDGIDVMERAFGAPLGVRAGELAQQLAEPRVLRYVAYLDDEPAATGALNVYPQLGFGLLWGGSTAPEARGRGAYSAVLAARMRAARELGLDYAGLYAIRSTSAPIVARQGFAEVGRMTSWVRRADATSLP